MTHVEVTHPIRTFRVTPRPSNSVDSLIDRVSRFLPDNFIAAADPAGSHVLVAGFDHAGWTRHGYLLPRLASGSIFPSEPGDAERRYDIVLNLFHEGYRAISDDLADESSAPEHFESRLDCIDFVLAQFALLEHVDVMGSAFQHGQDFYLTRNRHGTGFWDRGYGQVGKRLADAARIYGSTQ